jgi:hypothetical protein
MMELVVGIALLLGTFVPIVLVGLWILGPIDRAAKSREAPVRFSIGDFLCLFLAVQIPLTVIYQYVGEDERPLYWLFTIITWIMAPVIWFACARALSKAGVTASMHRFLFLGLVMPIVYYALVPFVILTMMGVGAIVIGNSVDPRPGSWLIAAWVALIGIFYVSGVFTRWIVRCGQPGLPVVPKDDSSDPAAGNEPSVTDLQRRLALARAAVSRHSQTPPPADEIEGTQHEFGPRYTGATMPNSGSISASGQPSHFGADRLQ